MLRQIAQTAAANIAATIHEATLTAEERAHLAAFRQLPKAMRKPLSAAITCAAKDIAKRRKAALRQS